MSKKLEIQSKYGVHRVRQDDKVVLATKDLREAEEALAKLLIEDRHRSLYELLLSDQLDHAQAVELVNKRPEFKAWLKQLYKDKYNNADNNITGGVPDTDRGMG